MWWHSPGKFHITSYSLLCHAHVNTYQFGIKLSARRCLTGPLLSLDTASVCSFETQTNTHIHKKGFNTGYIVAQLQQLIQIRWCFKQAHTVLHQICTLTSSGAVSAWRPLTSDPGGSASSVCPRRPPSGQRRGSLPDQDLIPDCLLQNHLHKQTEGIINTYSGYYSSSTTVQKWEPECSYLRSLTRLFHPKILKLFYYFYWCACLNVFTLLRWL